jgi:hypothetical protein
MITNSTKKKMRRRRRDDWDEGDEDGDEDFDEDDYMEARRLSIREMEMVIRILMRRLTWKLDVESIRYGS